MRCKSKASTALCFCQGDQGGRELFNVLQEVIQILRFRANYVLTWRATNNKIGFSYNQNVHAGERASEELRAFPLDEGSNIWCSQN